MTVAMKAVKVYPRTGDPLERLRVRIKLFSSPLRAYLRNSYKLMSCAANVPGSDFLPVAVQ